MGLSNEVKESLLQAMDIIATNAASQVAFDTTIKCTIVDTSKANDGQYTVSDGSTKFIAYSENTLYKVNEYVRVSIPNGDFSGEKYIIGKCASEDDVEPITYVSAENSILEIVNLINEDRKIELEANGGTNSVLINLPNISDISNITSNEIYSTLYMEISFQTQIEQLNMRSGTYGARLQIYDNSSNLIGVLDLNSSDFFGNPYSFKIPVKQSKKLSISGLNTISSFNLELYQKGDFTYIKNGQVKNLQPIGQNNIFITNIKIGIGTDLSLVEDNTVKIFTNDGLEYNSEISSKEKHINLLWYNKTEDNTYIGFSDGIAKKSGVNKKDYDENNFLNLQKNSARLRSQLIDDVPVDEFGLSLRADVFLDSIPVIKNIHTKIQKDLLTRLRDFEERIGLSCIPLKDIIHTTRGSVETFLSKSEGFEEKFIRISEIAYKEGMILTEKEYNNIKEISSGEEDFSVKFEKSENNKYKVLEDITAILKQPINPIEYQFSNIFAYCSDCQKKADDEGYLLPTRDIPVEAFYPQGLLTTTLQEIYDKINTKDGSMFESINDLVDGDSASYPSFKGVWQGWKPDFEKIISDIQTLVSQVKLPVAIQKSKNELTITVRIAGKPVSRTYSISNYSYERWEDSFDYDSYNNLYSIYWYRYKPGYESTSDKIISKDWEKINTEETNLGLPGIKDTGDDILYWDKNSTGENIPHLSIELNSELSQEKFKVVIVYNHNYYESNELVFTNVNDLTHTTLENEDLVGFQIVHGENSVGNYQDYYNFTNQLISSVESKKERTLIAKFQNTNDNNEEVLNNSSIYWYVPDGATMIRVDEKDLINKGFSTDKYKTVEGYEEKEYPTNTDFTEERFLQVRQIYDVDKEKWVDYTPESNLELNDKYYCHTRIDPEKGPLYKLQKNSKNIYKVRYYISNPYYSYQMINSGETPPENKKIIINNSIIIDEIEYVCIDVNTSKYVKKSDITLDTENTIFYVKPNSFYYTNSTIKIKFYKDEVISKSDAAAYYSSVNFNNIATFEDNNYTINEDIEIEVSSLEKGTIVEDSILFLSNSLELQNKVMIIFDEENKRKQPQKLSGYIVDGNFIVRSNLIMENPNTEKGTCSASTAVYEYKISQNSETNSKTKFVIESEFFDPLTNENYYKIWGQDNQFIKKSEYIYTTPYFSVDGYYCFYKKISDVNDRKFYYYIKDFFSQDATNNTIQCGIEGEGWNLEETLRTLSLDFGTYGANGTEYSIRVNPIKSTDQENGKIITSLNITLYNGNEELDFSQLDLSPELSWVGPTSCLIQEIKKDPNGKGYNVKITDRMGETIDTYKYSKDNYYALLKIIINLKSVSLESYYPVAYTTNIGYYIDGATSIIYDSLGTASKYCLDPYKIYSKVDNTLSSLDGVTWDIKYVVGLDGNPGENTTDTDLTKYMPTLKTDGPILQPLKLFVDNVNCYATVICKQGENIIWAQPIAILQNRFSSTTLNNWDGKLKIDEENNTILSAMIGAGRKNRDNSFSGVLMGDVAKADLSDSKIGLYGFHEGSQSFGFKVDGTAFLGKSGQGRIEFDGNSGIIKSAQWNGTVSKEGDMTPGTQGMAISLKDGYIDAHDFKLTSGNIQLDSNPVDGGNWINIGDENTYLRFTNTGELDIRVTNFELTYHQGENLLVNTAPLENNEELLIYDNAWFSNEKSSLTDYYPFAIYDDDNEDWIQNYQFYSKNSKIDNLLDVVFVKKSTSGFYERLWFMYNVEPNVEESEALTPDDVLYIKNHTPSEGDEISEAKDFYLYGSYLSTSVYDILNNSNNWKSGWKVKALFPIDSEWEDIDEEGVFKKYFKQGLFGAWFCKKSCWLFKPLQTADEIITKSMFEKYFKCVDEEFFCIEDIHITTDIPSVSGTVANNRYYSAQSSMYLDGKKRKSITLKDNIPLKQVLKQPLKENTNYILSGQLLAAKEMKLLKVYVPSFINQSTLIDQDTYENVLKIIFNGKEYEKSELFELNFESGKYYIKIEQSGVGILYYKDSTLEKDTVVFSLENEDKIIDSNSITWSNWGEWVNINLKFKTSKELANIFKLKKTSNKNYNLYLYHLKLEEGLTSTPWIQSTQEQNYADKIKQDATLKALDYTNDLNDMLDTSTIFDKLTDYGKKQGFFTDDKTGNLFINAECIGVGLLRSNEVNGTFYYKDGPATGVNLAEYENIAKEYENNSQTLEITDIQLSKGTLFDLRSGIIAAHKFELNAWDNENQKGLYLNSDPESLGAKNYWLMAGNDVNYIKFSKSGGLEISVTDFSLTYNVGKNLLYNTTPLELKGEKVQGWNDDKVLDDKGLSAIIEKKKCICINGNHSLNQTLKRTLSNQKKYTLSGQFYVTGQSRSLIMGSSLTQNEYNNISEIKTISGEIQSKEDVFTKIGSAYSYNKINIATAYYKIPEQDTITFKIGNEEKTITWEETNQWHDINLSFYNVENTTSFEISRGQNNVYLIYFYHLKLEEGLNATPWCQSDYEQNYVDQVYDYSKSYAENQAQEKSNQLNNLLNHNEIFSRLFSNGQIQGFATDENGNLYINASVIGTGLLRSNAISGTFDYNVEGTEEGGSGVLEPDEEEPTSYGKLWDEYGEKLKVSNINLTQGTLFDLNTGLFRSANFDLNVTTSIEDVYTFQEGYPYSGENGDASQCLGLSSNIKSIEDVANYIKDKLRKLNEEHSDLELGDEDLIKKYYDINRDGKITAADARLILRYSERLDGTTTQNMRLCFNDAGFEVKKETTVEGKTIEEVLFKVDYSGVYLKDFSSGDNSLVNTFYDLSSVYDLSYGTQDIVGTSGVEGQIYFKIIS